MDDVSTPRFAFRKRWLLYGSLLVVPAVLGIAWAKRVPIAKSYIDAELAKRGVRASYDLRAVGAKRQRLENIVIGDPKSPDLTADWAEVDVSLSVFGANVRAIRASGVKLRGRYRKGNLSLGSLDALMPATSGAPFSLPDIELALHDTRIGLITDYGSLGMRLDGRGNVASDFAGTLAIIAPKFSYTTCLGSNISGFFKLQTIDREILVDGPVRTQKIDCAAASGADIVSQIKVTLSEQLNHANGEIVATAKHAFMSGASISAAKLQSKFSLAENGSTAEYKVAAEGLSLNDVRSGPLMIDGQVQLRDARGLDANGTFVFADVIPSARATRDLTSYEASAKGTPAEEMAAKLASAVRRLDRGSTVEAHYHLVSQNEKGEIRLNGLTATSHSGARFSLSGVDAVRYAWLPGALSLNGDAVLYGGDFPTVSAKFSGRNGRISGVANVKPLTTGTSRISLSPVRFDFGSGATRIETVATFDGQAGTTRINHLVLPISVKGKAAFLSGCKDLTFNQLEIAGAKLGQTRVNACFSGDDVRIASPRLSGTYANARFDLAADAARYNLNSRSTLLYRPRATGFLGGTPFAVSLAQFVFAGGTGRFVAQTIAGRLGEGASTSRFDVSGITGQTQGRSATGTFTQAQGKIGAVPLNFSDGSGQWQFANSALNLVGRIGIKDAAAETRFQPMVSPDFKLRFADNQIIAGGRIIEPISNANVAQVSLRHDLANGAGHADLDVPGLTFGGALQPEQLTRITLGVIANVEGQVSGRGTVRWHDGKVESDGRFSTQGVDFAAAFGPVRKLRGEIEFTDLLGMVTAPSQSVEIADINSGIQVTDGVIRYRLMPGLKVEVEGGRWPFAGGELRLEPTVMQLDEESERRLTFRVIGLDAAKFVNQLALENIAATGTFDGVLPMIFDKAGGRIEAGNLIVREGGGTLSYIGEVSKENVGTFGMIAFDALKSMRYRNLVIGLGGPLDGEMISQIRFNGVNQIPIVPGRSQFKLPIPIKVEGLNGIPFIFNITIRAPFRGLVNTARDLQDPARLIGEQVEKERQRLHHEESKTGPATPVQP